MEQDRCTLALQIHLKPQKHRSRQNKNDGIGYEVE